MFTTETYTRRRKALKNQLKSGIALFLGNNDTPMNYTANTYHFRQDSTFLYFFGLDVPGLCAMIDIDSDKEIIFGVDFDVDDIVWMGPQQTLAEKAHQAGVAQTMPPDKLEELVKTALSAGRKFHFLPQYKPEHTTRIEKLSGIHHTMVNSYCSKEFIKAVVAQRIIKSDDEIKQIEMALDISDEMYRRALTVIKPGKYEYEVAGAVDGHVLSKNSASSFPTILTVHGEILHGHSHNNQMKAGDLLVVDSGAESPLHYASDITRTFPVSGTFTDLQKDLYAIVYEANTRAIEMMKPGVYNRDIHLQVARIIAEGMKRLDFMRGDMEQAVTFGAHALFFPHGLGHQLGLDVHDMEGLGEDFVGYDDKIKRSNQFGLAYLRFAKQLEPGMVLTVEPGIYFMPELIKQWKAQNKFFDYINYKKVESTIGIGGIRIEDDVLVTDKGSRVLGKHIPKTIEEIEAAFKK